MRYIAHPPVTASWPASRLSSENPPRSTHHTAKMTRQTVRQRIAIDAIRRFRNTCEAHTPPLRSSFTANLSQQDRNWHSLPTVTAPHRSSASRTLPATCAEHSEVLNPRSTVSQCGCPRSPILGPGIKSLALTSAISGASCAPARSALSGSTAAPAAARESPSAVPEQGP